ncbi:hypothetical protein FIU95_18265 [Microbulbifer sp. THAF38]|nr:hypothetical protein FIU95_18265 [Microbulbifer sp. THAF38]
MLHLLRGFLILQLVFMAGFARSDSDSLDGPDTAEYGSFELSFKPIAYDSNKSITSAYLAIYRNDLHIEDLPLSGGFRSYYKKAILLPGGGKYKFFYQYKYCDKRDGPHALIPYCPGGMKEDTAGSHFMYVIPDKIPSPAQINYDTSSVDGVFKVSWVDFSDADEYKLERSINGSGWSPVYSGGETSFSENIIPSSIYQYRVKACLSQYDKCSDFKTGPTKPVAPAIPSFVTVPLSVDKAYTVDWSLVDKADTYQLQLRLENGNSEGWQTVYEGPATTYTYESPLIYGDHEYQVKAVNLAGESDYSSSLIVTMEMDPAVHVLKQLYYIAADDVPLAEDAPDIGIFSKYAAAFQYLDLMYSLELDTESEQKIIVSEYLSNGISAPKFSDLYGAEERARANNAGEILEDYLKNEQSIDEDLELLLLDYYYDQAAAEVILANQSLDEARIVRLRGEPLVDEILHVNVAYDVLETGFEQYLKLLDGEFSGLLPKWSEYRSQTSPRYTDLDSQEQVDVIPDNVNPDNLLSGYKDIILFYQLMNKLAETKVKQVRLLVVSGGVTDDIAAEVHELYESLTEIEGKLRKEIFNDADFTQLGGDYSGLAEAVYEWQSQVNRLENTLGWITGETNILGLPQDVLLLYQGYGIDGNTDFHSYDVLRKYLDAPQTSPINLAIDSFNDAVESYNAFRYNASALATEYADRHKQLSDRLHALLGVRFDFDCHSMECVNENINNYPNSAVSIQALNIELAGLALEKNIQRMTNLHAAMDIEVQKREDETDIEDGILKVKMKTAEQDISLFQQIKNANERAAKVRTATGFIAGIGKILGSIKLDDPLKIVEAAASTAAGVAENLSEIDRIETIGRLEEQRLRLAAEERAALHDSESQLLDVASEARIRTMWLEASVIELDIAQSEVAVQQEAERLEAMLNEAVKVMNQMFATNEFLKQRYFADPIHGIRLTDDILRAERNFEDAQEKLFYATKALEHKWQSPFIGMYGETINTIFSLRNPDQLEAYNAALESFDLNSRLDSVDQVRDVISLKEDIWGYVDKVNDVIQTYPHPDPTKEGAPPLDALSAFRARLDLLSYEDNYGTWVSINFDTVRELVGSITFFKGPEIGEEKVKSWKAEEDTKLCLMSAGSYGDKIEEITLNIPLSFGVGRSTETPAYLTYAGTSYMRSKSPASPTQNDELNSRSVRFWTYSGISGFEPYSSATVEMAAYLDVNGNGPAAGSNSIRTTEFKERSVAASDWRLTIQLANSVEQLVRLDAINDIELIIDHRKSTRRGQGMCKDPKIAPENMRTH